MKVSRIHFDPLFVEEAVFLTVRQMEETGRKELAKSYYAALDQIYCQNLPSDVHERVLKDYYIELFSKTGLSDFFEEIAAEFDFYDDPRLYIFFKRVYTTEQEGAQLYQDGSLKRIFVGIQAARVLDLPVLGAFLRHELLHMADILDPHFQYSPNPVLGGESEMEDHLIRDRFRLLWDIYVDARLRRKGFLAIASEDRQKQDFQKAFRLWDQEKRKEIWQDLMSRKTYTQAELLGLCRDERLTRMIGEGGFRCPLCHFPSYDPMDTESEEFNLTAAEVKRAHPHWQPSQGICLQCFELFRFQMRIKI